MGVSSNYGEYKRQSAKSTSFDPTPSLTATNVQDAIVQASTATTPIGDFVDSGRKFGTPNGLILPITAGYDCIGSQRISRDANSITLDARKACLIYDKADGTTGKINAVYPTEYIDNNTVGFWIFNQAAGVAVPNSAVGVSSIAVANNLVPEGTFTRVDGRCDYAIKPDGTSARFVGANTNFPTGSNVTAFIRTAFRVNSLSAGIHILVGFGAEANAQAIVITRNGARLCVDYYGNQRDTGFDLEIGKDYIVDYGIIQQNWFIRVNGQTVLTGVDTPVVGSTFFSVCGRPSSSEFASETMYFVEVKNAIPSLTLMNEVVAKLLFPLCWDKTNSAYPTVLASDKARAYHEYKFDESSGTAVVDTSGTNNGTATGTTIVASDLGYARRFNGVATDYISLGSITYQPGMTVIAVCAPDNVAGNGRLFGGTTAGKPAFCVSSEASAGASFYTGESWVNSGLQINPSKKNFLAWIVNSDSVIFNVNDNYATVTGGLSASITTASTISNVLDNVSYMYKGTIDYLLVIPRALSKAEVSKMHSSVEVSKMHSSLMNKSRLSLKSLLPTNSVSLGYTYTGTSSIQEMDDLSWGYGRREGAVGGNRVVPMDYKQATASSDATTRWNSPFGCGAKFKAEYFAAKNASGLCEAPAQPYIVESSGHGVIDGRKTNGTVAAYCGGSGLAFVDGAWGTHGYLRPIFTVLEDD